jgi:hypothetical protein
MAARFPPSVRNQSLANTLLWRQTEKALPNRTPDQNIGPCTLLNGEQSGKILAKVAEAGHLGDVHLRCSLAKIFQNRIDYDSFPGFFRRIRQDGLVTF